MTGEPLKDDNVTVSPVSLSSVKSGAGLPSSTIQSSPRRAIGVVRVSRVGGRDGEQFVSPSEQAERIRTAADRDGLELVDTLEELDVSGGAPLARRPGLKRAVELVEAGEADVVIVAFFDRLVRSLTVQTEIVDRVEKAGGAILAVDIGAVSHGSAGQWLSGTMLGAVSEYHRRVTAERTQDAKRRAVARGVAPYANIPPGLRRNKVGAIEPHPEQARVVAEAFRMRATGATIVQVREHLRENGITRSFHGTQSMLTSRLYLGELRFGELVNLESHPAIVNAATWMKVQDAHVSRGRRAKSDRLLARLGILRCASCGSRMVVGTANHSSYYLYRCPPVGDCSRRVTISAEMAEAAVVTAVRDLLGGISGSASIGDGISAAHDALQRAEADLDAAIRAFTGLEDVESARSRLLDLRQARDERRTDLDRLAAAATPAVTVSAGDWDRLTADERRALIVAVIDRAEVAPGRGPARITVIPRA